MMLLYICASALLARAFAQSHDESTNKYGETGPNNASTPTVSEGEITVHIVHVGELDNQFVPNSIVAIPGDKVMFKFFPGNHSVFQSLYGWPCQPRDTVDGQEGFLSGFFPNTLASDPPSWNLTITDASPIFYYCGAPGSCIGKGMLGAINADSTTKLTKQIELAKAAKYMIEPGETMSPAASASISALAETVLAEPDESKDGSGLAAGAIAGIVIGAVVVLALFGVLIFFLRRNKKRKQDAKSTPHDYATQDMRDTQRYHYGDPNSARYGVQSVDSALLPPYQQYGEAPDEQDKLVEAPGSPPMDSYGSYSAQSNEFRFSGASELGGDVPTQRYELNTTPDSPNVHGGESGGARH